MKNKLWKDFCFKSGHDFNLSKIPTGVKNFVDFDKQKAQTRFCELNVELDKLQEVLYAQGQHKLLIVLQGMDTSGKDSTIRDVFAGVNPQGVKVKSFKAPTVEELAHDFLWRIHQAVPAKGDIVIFNRSHYEDVLAVRVHHLVTNKVWEKRYEHIVNFEKTLSDEGVLILKFFLHISKDEQRKRLQERVDDKSKHWKFRFTDLKEREFWPEYMNAYQEMIKKTSTDHAPWHVVPSDHKWFRNLMIVSKIVEALRSLSMSYPKPQEGLLGLKVK